MDSYKETFKTWNKIASIYEDKFMDLDLYNDTYDIFCELLDNVNPKILEIGCGPGNITKYILSKRPNFNIQGIDIAPNMIELARKNNPTANFKVMDGRQINKMESKFDAVICGFFLPYLSKSDRSNLIKDCNNLLSDKGILYLSFVDGDYINSGYQTGSGGDKIYFYYHSLENLEKDLTENNFNIINLTNKNYNKKDGTTEIHTILITKK